MEQDKLFFIGEIGLNHVGSLENAKKIIDIAVGAGCSAVKFQKRTPAICVPEDQKNVMRETPWGIMTYLEYRERIEFGEKEYDDIDLYCKNKGIEWFASPWDIESLKFLRKYDLKYNKVASALVTNLKMIHEMALEGKHVFVSTGMSTMEEIMTAVGIFRRAECPFTVMHCTSSYPCKFEDANLKMINTLNAVFPDSVGIGFSDHTKGLVAGPLAIMIGATVIEKHITYDRSAYGTDQSNSLEERGIKTYVRDCKNTRKMIGDGVKKIYDDEKPILKKLRK